MKEQTREAGLPKPARPGALKVVPTGLNLSDPNDPNRFQRHADVAATWAKFGFIAPSTLRGVA